MIDSLVNCFRFIDQPASTEPFAALESAPYFLATIHRPVNVDEPAQLVKVLDILESAARLAPLLFVSHPRTRERLQRFDRTDRLVALNGNGQKFQPGFIYLLPPLAYLDFMRLMAKSRAVLTDSGGIQEETTFLGIPCLTLRTNTERPVTVELGTNELVGLDSEKITAFLESIVQGRWKDAIKPPLWDGGSARRVVQVLREACS
jgi:UDP-N-acetylglucosamine 2-epimerase (non-hydrolysing)